MFSLVQCLCACSWGEWRWNSSWGQLWNGDKRHHSFPQSQGKGPTEWDGDTTG